MTAAAAPNPAPTPELTLEAVARALGSVRAAVRGDGRVRVSGLRQDSRRVQAGDLFAARIGTRVRGSDFVAQAVQRGARAVLVQRGTLLPQLGVPIIEVDDAAVGLALAAEAIHGHPTRSVSVVGITGTNGKTTAAWLAAHALSAAGGRAARLGTLGYAFEADSVDSPLTTPEADEVSRCAARARDAGATHLVMEVSSHALDRARVDALHFTVAVFTNLTQDHLDYHRTMQAYAASKARLFWDLEPERAVINVDDAFGPTLAERTPAPVLRVSRGRTGDVRPLSATLSAAGIRAEVALPSGVVHLSSPLVGEHNLENLLTALAIVEASSLDPQRAALALAQAPPVPGRLERCDGPGDDVLVLVDYAHTPDALRRVLQTARSLTAGDVICVFGCGGDRDPDKRPKMGSAVGAAASYAIVSNDNPRTEDPRSIAEQIEPGLRAHGIGYTVELDRSAAIERAILQARGGDAVLIAGKGHEPYQLIGAERRPFDDCAEARRALALRRGRDGC
jgi:UDP-N-acetylmuramoyl-L-alanyl-D-glutamate--2,6-diaminopimelate ligase